jgi:predicted nucleotidyltransferase
VNIIKERIKLIEKIQAELVEEFKKDSINIGAMIHGSYARGKAHAQSDMDIFCITNADWFSKEIRMIDDVEVEIQTYPITRLRETVEKRDEFFTVAIAYAIIMFDNNGEIKLLQESAKEAMSMGPTSPSKMEILLGKSYFRHRLEEVEKIASKGSENGVLFQLLVHQIFKGIIEAFYRTRHLWKDKLSYMFDEISEKYPEFWKLCCDFNDAKEDMEKVIVLKKLVEYTLEPVGGLVIEYQTPKVPISKGTTITPIFFH